MPGSTGYGIDILDLKGNLLSTKTASKPLFTYFIYSDIAFQDGKLYFFLEEDENNEDEGMPFYQLDIEKL